MNSTDTRDPRSAPFHPNPATRAHNPHAAVALRRAAMLATIERLRAAAGKGALTAPERADAQAFLAALAAVLGAVDDVVARLAACLTHQAAESGTPAVPKEFAAARDDG